MDLSDLLGRLLQPLHLDLSPLLGRLLRLLHLDLWGRSDLLLRLLHLTQSLLSGRWLLWLQLSQQDQSLLWRQDIPVDPSAQGILVAPLDQSVPGYSSNYCYSHMCCICQFPFLSKHYLLVHNFPIHCNHNSH